MNLCGRIFDYEGEMLQFKDENYKAPFRPSKQADRNLKKIYSIFTTIDGTARGKTFVPQADSEIRNIETEQGGKKTPIYIEELKLSRFIEDYLDQISNDTFKHFQRKSSNDKGSTSAAKVLNDISMILEIDRVIFKTFNALIGNCILPYREKFAQYLEADEGDAMGELDKRAISSQGKKD